MIQQCHNAAVPHLRHCGIVAIPDGRRMWDRENVTENVSFWLRRGHSLELRSRAVVWPIMPWPTDRTMSRARELEVTLGVRVLDALSECSAADIPVARQATPVVCQAGSPDGGPGYPLSEVPVSPTDDQPAEPATERI